MVDKLVGASCASSRTLPETGRSTRLGLFRTRHGVANALPCAVRRRGVAGATGKVMNQAKTIAEWFRHGIGLWAVGPLAQGKAFFLFVCERAVAPGVGRAAAAVRGCLPTATRLDHVRSGKALLADEGGHTEKVVRAWHKSSRQSVSVCARVLVDRERSATVGLFPGLPEWFSAEISAWS